REISLTLNGTPRSTRTDGERPLLDVLREDFQLTGTKYGCGEGECGACTVLVGGKPRYACLAAVEEVDGEEVLTIEGLADGDQLHTVQQAFLDQQGLQCGYCVPGHIMRAVSFCRDHPGASREEVVGAMSAHICSRCSYPNTLAAVERAVRTS